MRVTGDMTSELIRAIERTSSQQEEAFQQLGSGRRIQYASDDPAAFSLAMHTTSRMAENDQFQVSTGTIKAMMQTADSTLNSVVSDLTRAVSLGVEGANASVSSAQRASIAAEVLGIRDTILSLANVAFNDTYLFGGTKSTQPPFMLDATDASGVRYVGSTEVNQVQVGESLKVDAGVAGDEIFRDPNGDVFGALNTLYSALMNNDATAVANATGQLRTAFDHVSTRRVFYGNTMQQLEQNGTFLSNNKAQLSQEWDTVVGADPTEAASRLINAQQAHDRTLAAAARVSSLSLLDYLE